MGSLRNDSGGALPEDLQLNDVSEELQRTTKDVLDTGADLIELEKIKQETNTNVANSNAPAFDVFEHIDILDVKAFFVNDASGNNTRISEKPKIVQWRGQHFKCKVLLSLDQSVAKSDWTIGLAQACNGMLLENKFGNDGAYKWEFHPMKSKRYQMINDSNGSQWPFYSHRTSMLDLIKNRPVPNQVHELKFSDYFYPTMHWEVNYLDKESYLTEIERNQSFVIWLVAIKRGKNNTVDGQYSRYEHYLPNTDTMYVMKTMSWKYNVKLKFDTKQELGKRCVSIDDVQEQQPIIYETVEDVPTSAMVAPNCNSCQSLFWYPTNNKNTLVMRKEPDDIIVPWKEWIKDMTKGYPKTKGFEIPEPPPRLFKLYAQDPIIKTFPISKFNTHKIAS